MHARDWLVCFGWAVGAASLMLSGQGCKKEPALPQLAPSSAAVSEKPMPSESSAMRGEAPAGGAREKPVTVDSVAAAVLREDGGATLIAPGTPSRALQRYWASQPHQKVAQISREMLDEMKAGQCAKAIDRAKELADAIRAAGGELRPSLDVRAMARAIQNDPDFMDRAYMNYKSTLVGLAIGIEFAPMTVKLSASNPAAQKQACERFAKYLADIRQPE